MTAPNYVICQSADGWSVHAPGSTDEQIAAGDAPYILSGPGRAPSADEAERRVKRAIYAAKQDRAHAQRYLNSRANFPFQLR